MAAIRGTSSGRRRNVNLIGLCAILLTFVCLHVGWPTQDFDSQPPTFKGTPDNVGVAQPSNLGERDGTPQHRDRTPLVIADGHPRDWPRASPSGDNSRSVPEGDSSKVEDKVDDSSQPQTAATTAPQVVSPPRPQRVAQTLTSTDASTAQVGSSCSVLPAVVTHKVTLERVCEGYERDPPKNDTVYLEAGPRLFHTTESLWVKWRVNGCLTNDKIALFTVDAARDGGNKNYLSYRLVTRENTTKCEGTVAFHMLNIRANFVVRYIRRTGELMGWSNVVCGDRHFPMQGRLALTTNPSVINLMWVNGVNATPQVQYGTSPDKLEHCEAAVSTETYSATDMHVCHVPKRFPNLARDYFMDPGMIHSAFMRGLQPKTRYYYRFGSPSLEGGWSAVYTFVSAPAPAQTLDFKWVVFGDLGTVQWPDMSRFPQFWDAEASGHTTDRLNDHLKAAMNGQEDPEFDFVLHTGDISYAIGFAPRWEQFSWQTQQIATTIPYLVSDGNHEVTSEDSYGECGVPFSKRFYMPHKPAKYYYSIDYSHVHLVVLSTEFQPIWEASNKQLRWLEQDLAAVDRSITPWIVVSGHRPLYISDYHSDRVKLSGLQKRVLEPLFQKYDVSISFWGHIHNYERTCKVLYGKCVDKGPVSVLVGTGGKQTTPQYFARAQPAWSVRRHSAYGYGNVTVTRDTFDFQFVDSKDGTVQDHFTLHRNGTVEDHWRGRSTG